MGELKLASSGARGTQKGKTSLNLLLQSSSFTFPIFSYPILSITSIMSQAHRNLIYRWSRRGIRGGPSLNRITQSSVQEQDEQMEVEQQLCLASSSSFSLQVTPSGGAQAIDQDAAEEEGEVHGVHLLFFSLSKCHPLTISWKSSPSSNPDNLRLPPEIYLMIFERLTLNSLVTASRTCKGWNRLSNSSTGIWSWCDLSGFPSFQVQFKALKNASRLSKDTLKVIVLSLTDRSIESNFDKFLSEFSKILESNKGSLKALSLVFPLRFQFPIFKSIMELNLELASLFISNENNTSFIPKGVLRMNSNLRSLSIDSARLDSLDGLRDLRSLQIGDELTGSVRISHLLEENRMSLESLKLSNKSLSEFNGRTPTSLIILPNLQQLGFSSGKSPWPQREGDFKPIGNFIKLLRSPMLFELKCEVEMLADLNEILGTVTLLNCYVGKPIVKPVVNDQQPTDTTTIQAVHQANPQAIHALGADHDPTHQLAELAHQAALEEAFHVQLLQQHPMAAAVHPAGDLLAQIDVDNENDWDDMEVEAENETFHPALDLFQPQMQAPGVIEDPLDLQLLLTQAQPATIMAYEPIHPVPDFHIVQPQVQAPTIAIEETEITEEPEFEPLPTSPGITLLNSYLPRLTSLQRLTVSASLPISDKEDVLDGDELLMGLLARGPRGLVVRNLAFLETKGLDCTRALIRMVIEDRENQRKTNKGCTSIGIECKL